MKSRVWVTKPIAIVLLFSQFFKSSINNITALVQIIASWRPADKPLSEPMMVSILMHIYICVTLPQ